VFELGSDKLEFTRQDGIFGAVLFFKNDYEVPKELELVQSNPGVMIIFVVFYTFLLDLKPTDWLQK